MKKNNEGREVNRVAISKKVRFEVFKRDRFTCQYCGQKSPDVVLNVDHIAPVAKGGDNDLMNLITSCHACNNGKRDRELSDDSMVQKQRAQLEDLAERRDQLDMMIQWRDGLKQLEDDKVQLVVDRAMALVPRRTITAEGRSVVVQWLRGFDFETILQAIDEAGKKVKFGDNGFPTDESAYELFDNIGRFAAVIKNSKGDSSIQRLYYVRGILNRRCTHLPAPYKILSDLKALAASGVDPEDLVHVAKSVSSYSKFIDEADELHSIAKRSGA